MTTYKVIKDYEDEMNDTKCEVLEITTPREPRVNVLSKEHIEAELARYTELLSHFDS